LAVQFRVIQPDTGLDLSQNGLVGCPTQTKKMDDERVMLVLAKIPRHGFGDYLVGGIPTPLKKKSVGMLIPNILWKNQPTNQPALIWCTSRV
jgi:hypothetical protein